MATRQRATRDDVARLAGTSSAVVSYVVNNGPRNVRPETRARVLAAIDQLGYEPNRIAAALRSQRSELLGLIVPTSTLPFFAQLRQALETAAFVHGRLLLTGSTGFDEVRERDFMDAFDGLRVDGLIVVAASPTSERAHTTTSVPVVYVHRAPATRSARAVTVDNEKIGYLATRHLLDHGHKAVWCLGDDEPGPVRERVAGWRRAMKEAGHSKLSRYARSAGSDRGAAQAATREWLASDRPPRAIFAATDEHAIGVLSAAQREGRTVPDGLAVIGADNLRESEYTVPRLSTVAMPIEEMAALAVAQVLDADAGPGVDLSGKIRLVPRDSCGC